MPQERPLIPLLEYDPDPVAVVMPDRENGTRFPKDAVFGFLGDTVEGFAAENGCPVLDTFVSVTKEYPVFLYEREGRAMALCQAPVGSAASVQVLDWLYARGADRVICAGSCGVLRPMPENMFFVPKRALRDEGTSFHYLPPSRFVELDGEMQRHIRSVLEEKGLCCEQGITWSTDGFFRETRSRVDRRIGEGCDVVEMECSALAACAAFRKKRFGIYFYTADSLADPRLYDERGWGLASMRPALELCIDMVAKLPETLR